MTASAELLFNASFKGIAATRSSSRRSSCKSHEAALDRQGEFIGQEADAQYEFSAAGSLGWHIGCSGSEGPVAGLAEEQEVVALWRLAGVEWSRRPTDRSIGEITGRRWPFHVSRSAPQAPNYSPRASGVATPGAPV